jgi:peroxiredoxin
MTEKDLEVGSPAPDFSAPTQGGGEVSLSGLRGQPVVLYFYPKDNTPGCTQEATDFRNMQADFERSKVRVVGVSKDSVKSHDKFAEKYELNFPLVADPAKDICEAYGVIREKKMYGKTVMGVERSTFLIDAKGRIARIWRGVKVAGHAEEVLRAAESL